MNSWIDGLMDEEVDGRVIQQMVDGWVNGGTDGYMVNDSLCDGW